MLLTLVSIAGPLCALLGLVGSFLNLIADR